jgi:hypothetical protein
MLVNAFGAIALDATVALVKASVDLVKTAVDELKTAVTDGTLRGTVMVSGPVDTGLAPLTDAQLRATPVAVDGTVLVANPTADPETGLAKDVTVGRRFAASPTRLTRATTVSTIGDTMLVEASAAQKVRLYWIGLATPETNGAAIVAQIKIGSTIIYDWPLGAPGAFAHFEIVDGALDEDLVINLSGAQPVKVNYTYEVI